MRQKTHRGVCRPSGRGGAHLRHLHKSLSLWTKNEADRLIRDKGWTFILPWILFLTATMAGCISTSVPLPPPPVPAAQAPQGEDKGWWFARFRIAWPEEKDPSWYVDLPLAHRVVSPALAAHRDSIALWRFHRRALRDKEGHQFSFIFYAHPETARSVFRSIRSDRTLEAMKAAGIILEDLYDDTGKIGKPRIEDTCDLKWSSDIQKAWPFFIMGVSQAWLGLISDMTTRSSEESPPQSVEEMLTLYEKVHDAVTTLWREEGGHAFLHHLNGIFGYENVAVYERRLMKF